MFTQDVAKLTNFNSSLAIVQNQVNKKGHQNLSADDKLLVCDLLDLKYTLSKTLSCYVNSLFSLCLFCFYHSL